MLRLVLFWVVWSALPLSAATVTSRPAKQPSLEGVIQECERALAAEPQGERAAAAVGRAAGLLLERKEYAQAAAWLEGLIPRYPQTPGGLAGRYHLGIIRESQGQAARALQAYRELVALAPDTDRAAAAVSRLAHLSPSKELDPSAVMQEIVKGHPGTLAAWQAECERAGLLLAAGKAEEADAAYLALLAGAAPEPIKAQARVARSAVSYRLMSLGAHAYYAKDYASYVFHIYLYYPANRHNYQQRKHTGNSSSICIACTHIRWGPRAAGGRGRHVRRRDT